MSQVLSQVFQIVLESEDGTETTAAAVPTAEGLRLIQIPTAAAVTAVAKEGEEGQETAEGDAATVTAIVGEDGVAYVQVQGEGGEGIVQAVQVQQQQQQEEGEEEGEGEQQQQQQVQEPDVQVAEEATTGQSTEKDASGDERLHDAAPVVDVEEGSEAVYTAVSESAQPATIAVPTTTETTLVVETAPVEEGEAESAPTQPQPLYLLQSPPSYKLELLNAMHGSSSTGGGLLDFPVFCRDGLAWSSRLLLTAMSPMLREALSGAGADQGAESCIVLPDVSRAEFNAFAMAVFAREGDDSLDFLVLIKVAETIGAQIVSETS